MKPQLFQPSRPRRHGRICPHSNRLSCGKKHTRDDNQLGEPLCPDCHDYTGAVLFNACAPELWRRFTIILRRAPARLAGLTNKVLAGQVRVSYAKVAGVYAHVLSDQLTEAADIFARAVADTG